ncbi:MAG: hypothetical protein ACW99G_04955 [Candidatus Thorarchaeota archaeon]|jgi:hypothetical protein
MHPSVEEMEEQKLKLIPAGASVKLKAGMYSAPAGAIGKVVGVYRSASGYECCTVQLPEFCMIQAFPNYLLEEVYHKPTWEL